MHWLIKNVYLICFLTITFDLNSVTGVEYTQQEQRAQSETVSSSPNVNKFEDGSSKRSQNSGTSGSFQNVGNHPNYPIEPRNSYAMLSQAMSQAVIHEFNSPGMGGGTGNSPADGTCLSDDLECLGSISDRLGMEAIKQLHRQLDDDDNGNIDIAESDDFLREELKYDSGYEKRHRAFHYNDDMHISVKELWEAWLRSEVHNWTIEQTTEWLAQSVQLPQYVDVFRQHKVTGASLPRLAVNNMHYVGNILGIRDPIHKQKIALKAMDVVLFGPPRETGNRWKDYVLVTLLLSAIIGCWYAYQQNKNAKNHLRRMARDMEGLQKAEKALEELQTELERARMEQENAASEKMDLLRRLKEQPSLSSSSSDLEVQHLKQEIEMLRNELSRAEGELVDHCWAPPQGLQSWLQLTYEIESRYHLKKRLQAEKQLQLAREACEKLKKKRSSLVGAFVSTHGKSIDDVDRSIVEARNALSEVTNELQERMHRWKQIEVLLGFSIINNNGISYLENILYNRNSSTKSSRSRITSSQDDLDDESTQGFPDNCGRYFCEDSSNSDDGDNQSITFVIGNSPVPCSTDLVTTNSTTSQLPSQLSTTNSSYSTSAITSNNLLNSASLVNPSTQPNFSTDSLNISSFGDESRQTQSLDRIVPLPRTKKVGSQMSQTMQIINRAPLPPPRRSNSHQSVLPGSQMAWSENTSDVVSMESTSQSVSSTSATDPLLEDNCSTDSSSIDDEHKRRRRKLHFPFGKKKSKFL